MNQFWHKHKHFLKVLSSFLLLAFLLYDISWASGGQVSFAPQKSLVQFELPDIPKEIGSIEEIFQPGPNQNSPVVYHIQDAHAVYEAQSNLAKILETLIQREGISLVLVEGGTGNVSLSSLRKSAWKPARRRIAEEFLKKGKISGEEYLQVASDYPFELIGIEDSALYRANIEVFLRALRRKPETLRRLSQIESHIRSLQAEMYPPKFRQLEVMRQRWRKGEENLLQYVLTLKDMTREKGIKTTSYREWIKLSNLEKGIQPTFFDQKIFFKELSEIEHKVRSQFLTTELSKVLWQLNEDTQLLKKLFNFEMTSEEYERVQRNAEILDSEKLYAKLKSVSGDRPLASVRKAVQFLEQEKGLFFEFYELAEKRDQAFIRNIQRILKDRHPQKAVLITGGFHSNHLGQLFKEKGISRVLISPGITKINESVDSDYEKILREKNKSTLRAPATLGTPYFVELKGILEREQSRVLEDHIKRLISYLDVDKFLKKPSKIPSALPRLRSELRTIQAFANVFTDLSNTEATILWSGLAGLGVLAVGLTWYLLRNRKQKAKPTKTHFPEILLTPSLTQDEELPFEMEDYDLIGELDEEPTSVMPFRKASDRPVKPSDPAKAFGIEARRFFEASFPVVPPREDLPPPPYELPLPIPAEAIPQDQDAKGKIIFILREVLQAMETMDGHMRSQQKESAERALRRVLEEGDTDPEKYRSYLQEDLHQFFRGIFEEMKRMKVEPQEPGALAVSEEMEESFPRFPRLVKHLLSENPALTEDPEIKTLMSRISGKFITKPPVAEDIADYVERAYRHLKEEPEPRPEPEDDQIIAGRVPPAPRREIPRIQPPKKTIDSERIKAQLRDLERMREKLEGDQRKLNLEIQKVQTEHRELEESLNQARANQDKIIEDALRPSIEAYESRLQKLRLSRGELVNRLNEINIEEERLRALLAEDGGGGTTRSEIRVLASAFSVSMAAIGVGVLALGIAYLITVVSMAHQNAKALIASKEKNWPFKRGRIFKETVSFKEEERTNLFKNDNAGSFTGVGVLAGWVIGGIVLYHAYYTWDWASKVLFEAKNYQGKKEPATLGTLLWLLEIFGAPFIGGSLGYTAAFLVQTITNFAMLAYRALRFPFDYERALMLHFLPYESLSASDIKRSAQFLSQMSPQTLEVILQNWVERAEHQKIKAFSATGILQGDKKKFVELYEDVAGLGQAKELLLRSFASTDEHKELITEIVRRWKMALDRKKLNGSRLLKDLIPELVKSEKKYKEVSRWIVRLTADAMTPWSSGFASVKTHYQALKQFDRLKAEASRKFSLTDEDNAYLEAQLQNWKKRIPSSAHKLPGTLQLLVAILDKVVQISQNKIWFFHSLKKISEIDSTLFNPSRQRELLARFDQTIGFEMTKGRMLGEADVEERKVLVAEFTAIEVHLKNKGVDAPSALTSPFVKLRELPQQERIAVLERFRGLDASVYQKDGSQIGHVFDVLTANERAKAKLLALGDGAPESIREIESKGVLTSLEDINNLSGFYSVLAEKIEPPGQLFLLNLTARAPPSVLPVFIRSHDSLISFYSTHPTGRDYENLPHLAEEYRIQYGWLQFFTTPLLRLLTDSGKSHRERIEEAQKTIASQTLIRLGYPENVIEIRDAISIDEIIRALGQAELERKDSTKTSFPDADIRKEGEAILGQRSGHSVVRIALLKMGRLGLYNYWESSKPAYYLQFLEDTKGIDPSFFKPGEKLRVAYERDEPLERKAGSLNPIINPVQEMKSLIVMLRRNHPDIYENFIAPKRELLRGKLLEEVIEEKTVVQVANQFKTKVADWPLTANEKIEMTLKVHEVLFSNAIRPVLGQGTAEGEAEYWKEMLKLFQQKSGLKKESDLSRSVVAQVRKRIDELASETGVGREGVVQFILTRGTISDFVRGEISQDCCSERGPNVIHFSDTVGNPTDPAFLSFRLVENGKWIGNIYAIVLKDQEGKFIFYLDNMPVRIHHPVTTTQAKADKLMKGFYQKLKELLEASGFDYFVTAPDPSTRENIRNVLRALGGTDQAKTATKPGGFGHKTEFGLSSEHIQGLGTLSSSISANGKWITLDNRAAKQKRMQLEIQELQGTLLAIETERKGLEKTKTEKAEKLKHLKERSQSAAVESKHATAQALIDAAQQLELELSRITQELKGLEAQKITITARLEGLGTARAASRSEIRTIGAVLGQILAGNGLIKFLFLASLVGTLAWIGWLLIKNWLAGSDKAAEPMKRTGAFPPADRQLGPALIPAPERPIWFRHPLVMEVTDLFKLVLKKVSNDIHLLIPRKLFFPIPYDMGMRLSEQIIRTLSMARTVLTALRDHDSLIPFLKKQNYYQSFKERVLALGLHEEFDTPGFISSFQMTTRQGKEVSFSLELSDRTADDLLKGDISRDCTGLGACEAFYETIPQFLLDPGFLNIKLRLNGKWVGNIYLMVAEKEGKPVLVIDAVQLPPAQNTWPVHPIPIAQVVVHEISKWAQEQNFDQVVMSSFVSNFTYLYDDFNFRYPRQEMEIEKLGGFEHLKELGFWDQENGRNQYIETFSSHWNQPLEAVDPNNPKQKLLLRPIWERSSAPVDTRSEVRSVQTWKIEDFELEVPSEDLVNLTQLVQPPLGEGQDSNLAVLTAAIQSPKLQIANAFYDAGYTPGMKIHVRVHDEDDKRIYKFILVTPKGRRNFILKVTSEKAVFQNYDAEDWKPYTEDLNLLDTALMTAKEDGQIVGLRNIFSKWGETSDLEINRISSHGKIYVRSIKEYGDTEHRLRVFDLTIQGYKSPSIWVAIKPREGTVKTEFLNANAVYSFQWNETAYLLGIYSPSTGIKLQGESRDEKLNPVKVEMFTEVLEDKSITLMSEPISSTPSQVVAPETLPIASQSESLSKPSEPEKLVTKENQVGSTSSLALPETVSNVARSGFVGMGSEIVAQARRMALNARNKKIGEKVRILKTTIEALKTRIKQKSDEIQKTIQSFDLDLPIKALLAKITALETEFRNGVAAGHKEIQNEIMGYKEVSELETFYQSLQQSASEIEGDLQAALRHILEAKTQKIREKTEFSKIKIQKITESIVQNIAAIRVKIEAISLDLPPKEIIDETRILEDELISTIESSLVPIQEEVQSYDLDELRPIYIRLTAFAEQTQKGILDRLQVLEEEGFSPNQGSELVEETITENIPAKKAETVPTAELDQEILSKQTELESVAQEIAVKSKELEAIKQESQVLGEQIGRQREETTSLEQNRLGILAEIQSLDAQKKELENQTAGLEQNKEQKLDIDREITRLAEQIQAGQDNLRVLNGQLLRAREEQQKLIAQRQTLEHEIAQKRGELEGITAEKEQAQRRLEVLLREIGETGHKVAGLSETEKQFQTVSRQLEEQEEKLAKKRQQIEEANRLLEQGETALKTLTAETENRRKVLQGLNQSVRDLKEQITLQNKELASLRKSHTELTDELQHFAGQKQVMEEELKGYEALKAQVEEATQALELARTQRKGAEHERLRLKDSNAYETKRLEALQTQITQAEQTINEKESLLQDLAAKEQERKILLQNIEHLERETTAKQEMFDALSRDLPGMERTVSTLQSKRDTLLSRLGQVRLEIEAMESAQVKARSEYEEIQAKLAEAKTAFAELPEREQKLLDLTRELEQKEQTLREKEEASGQADRTIEEKTTAIQELDRQLNSKSQALQARTEELEVLDTRLGRDTEVARELNGRISSLKQDLKTLEARKQELKGQIDVAGPLTEQLEQTRQTLQKILQQKEQAEREHQKILTEHEQALQKKQTLQAEIGQYNQEVDTLKTQKIQSLEELDTLKQTRIKLLGEVSSLEEKDRELKHLEAQLQEERTAKERIIRGRDEASETNQKTIDTLTTNLRTVGQRLKDTMADLEKRDQESEALRTELAAALETVQQIRDKATEFQEKIEQLRMERDEFESDAIHLKQAQSVLEEKVRRLQQSKQTVGISAQTLNVEIDANESLKVLLEELPDELWKILHEHFPGKTAGGFELSTQEVAFSLKQGWNSSDLIKEIVKRLVLYRSLYRWFQAEAKDPQSFYSLFKNKMRAFGMVDNFDKPGEWVQFNLSGDKRKYALELSDRGTEYLLRGFLSGDCTNCGPGYVTVSFITATGSHIVDPGFFNFKILREGEWVGNVYGMAIEEKGKPILVIDAIQIPWRDASPLFIPFDLSQSHFPIGTEKDAVALAEGVIGALGEYSKEVGYQELWLSSFVSNFSALKSYFYGREQDKFDRRVTAMAKIGGWDALRALGYEGHPYVESIGHPEAKKVWPLEDERPARQAVEAPPPKEKPAPPAQREVAAVAPPETQVQKEQVVTIERRDIASLVERVKEGVDFASKGILMREMEFIIQVQETPLRWIAFDDQALEWRVFEKSANELKTYPLFERGTGVRQKAGTLNLSQVEIEVQGSGKVPLPLFLKLPPLALGLLETYLEDGGALIIEDGRLKLVPFLKKGFIGERFQGAFFVHPGDERLDGKANLALPLSNHYEWLRQKFPKARFLLGWHTNPAGMPILHKAEEVEIAKARAEGFQLVASPNGIALVQYYQVNGQWKKKTIFTKNLTDNWATELEGVLNRILNSKSDVSASGYQLGPNEKRLLDQALEAAHKGQPRNIKTQIQKLYFDLGTSYGLEASGLEAFIKQSDFKLVVVEPGRNVSPRAPPMGLGVELGRPGRDVFATFETVPKEMEDGFEIIIYVGNGIYELAEEKERLEIFAHELYQAYRVAYDENPRAYPLDIDLELKIDEEIRRSQDWESRIPRSEREDLGLMGGAEKRTDLHVRARAFARLLGTPSPDGIGTTYTQLLRNAYALSRRFASREPQIDDPLNAVPPLEDDAFRYTQDSFQNVVSAEGLQRLFEMSAYINEHKEEELTDFLEQKISEGKNLILLNQNAPTPWILKDTRKIIEDLAVDGKLTQVFIDLPPQVQPLIDQYLATGRASEELLAAISSRFPPFLPKEFQRPDLYENLLRAVYEHNLEARNDGKIQVTAYYQDRQLPPMPQHGNFPPRPGDMPFRQPGEQPFQAPPGFGERGAQPPIMPRPGELPFPPGMPLPQLPLTRGVKEAFQKALSEAEKNQNSGVLFLKPLDEFLPEELSNHASVASILHIDKYTGYGPKKPENQLALYMSEQASPNQKSFALPILAEAPFYEESVNPGLPKGIRFNDFNSYPDLILSTAGEGDETFEPMPDEVVPEEVGPLVPVGGGRSELRLVSANAVPILKQRDTALRELIQIGEPAVGPLVDALALPSITLKLGAIQALGVIGDPRAIGPLNQLTQVAELREAARVAVDSINQRENVSDSEKIQLRSLPEVPAVERTSVQRALLTPHDFVGKLTRGIVKPDGNITAFVKSLLKQNPVIIDLDVETLIQKEHGRVHLSGWGFLEVLRVLEKKLPDGVLNHIRIRFVNLNPELKAAEIADAFGITPELKGMVEVVNLPVNHYKFSGVTNYLKEQSITITSEKNKLLWQNQIDILVKTPKPNELLDGRKLFLAALLHSRLKRQLPDHVYTLVAKLLDELRVERMDGRSIFSPESRSSFDSVFLTQMELANRLLAQAA